MLGFLPRIKVTGACGWPPAVAGEKVRDEWFISVHSLCAFMDLSETALHFYMHFSVVHCTVSVADPRWADLVIKSGLTSIQKIYTFNTLRTGSFKLFNP